MHMVCESCKFEFCWLCLEEWSKHNSSTGGFYKCNIYVAKDDPDKTKIEIDLQKYNFYSERFFEHLKAVQKSVTKKKIATEQFAKLCRNHNISDSGEFLQVALEGIIDTRRLLLYTFPLAYFADFSSPAINKEIFAFQQGELEVHLERLERLTDYLLIRDTPKLATPHDVRIFVREVSDMCKTLGQYFSTMIDYFAKALTVVEEQPVKEGVQLKPAPIVKEETPRQSSKTELTNDSQLWSCPKCTFHNSMTADSCEMCSYRRESLTQHN
jgi:ariadne-1